MGDERTEERTRVKNFRQLLNINVHTSQCFPMQEAP